MPVTASALRSPVLLALAEDASGQAVAAPWIEPLLTLGTRAARFIGDHPERQLVVAISVPSRDFAAALIGCGWVMASEAATLPDPLETLRSIGPGTPLRVVNDQHVISEFFSSLNESANPPRAQFSRSTWRTDRFRALAVLPELEAPEKTLRPQFGSVGRFAHLDKDWDARLAAPAADLAIVGTVTWLKEDFNAGLSCEGDGMTGTPIRDLLLPNVGRVATWFTRVYSSARLAEHLPLPGNIRSVILDGAAAIKYIAEIEAPALICILDRSVADETAAEILLQLRNTRGEPISIQEDLGWRAPTGVEALAFTAAL